MFSLIKYKNTQNDLHEKLKMHDDTYYRKIINNIGSFKDLNLKS